MLFSDANLFKTNFEEAKEIVKTKCKLYNGEDNEEESDDDSEKSGDEIENKDDTVEVSEKLSKLEVTKREEKSEE